jgi:multisite-specific tRNA:(cytosine-C5)-methyltransferase
VKAYNIQASLSAHPCVPNSQHSAMARGRGRSGGRGRSNRHKPALPTKRRRQENAASAGDAPQRHGYLEPKDRRSDSLEEYYTAQAIVPAEELPTLFSSLAVPLPTSFRVTADSRFCDNICAKLENEFKLLFDNIVVNRAANNGDGELLDASTCVAASDSIPDEGVGATQYPLDVDESEPIVPPTKLPWYPGGLGWTVAIPRFLVRRNNILAPFHKFLVRNNTLGLINRQEAVSMVPPLLLDVQPGHSVLDLCAAPGSKSAQLLEALANSASAPKGLSAGGLVIANDADIKRCWMLAHQLKRFGAPNLMVTHHDAQSFPAVTPFDRVLCDVPCSGDGTLRKAPDMWRRWTPMLGNGIHRLQKNILRRGVELLSPGGRIIYSTCSMNPVENEAIVADALRHFGPTVLELIDVSAELPLLKRRNGLVSWKVKDTAGFKEPGAFGTEGAGSPNPAPVKKHATSGVDVATPEPVSLDGNEKSAADEGASLESVTKGKSAEPKEMGFPADGWFAKFSQVPERRRKRVVETLFPPTDDELASGHFPLERCMRLVPYDQDTGSFFVAVLVKKGTPAVGAPVAIRVEAKTDGNKDTADKAAGDMAVEGQSADVEADGSVTLKAVVNSEAIGMEEDGGTVDDVAGEGEGDGMLPATAGNVKKGVKERQGSRLITDDPLVGLERVNEAVMLRLSDAFGLDEASCRECLMTRGAEKDKFKRVLVVSPAVRAMLRLSIGSPEGIDASAKGKLRVVNAGVRVFERTSRRDTDLPFRILSDGIEVLRRSMSKRIVAVDMEDLQKMLVHEAVDISSFAQRETRVSLNALASGSAVMVCGEGNDAECVLIWKGQYKVTKLMPSDEVDLMLARHGLTAAIKTGKAARDISVDDAAGADAAGAAVRGVDPGVAGDAAAVACVGESSAVAESEDTPIAVNR